MAPREISASTLSAWGILTFNGLLHGHAMLVIMSLSVVRSWFIDGQRERWKRGTPCRAWSDRSTNFIVTLKELRPTAHKVSLLTCCVFLGAFGRSKATAIEH